jgi:tRNA (guanine37-N1)-methyltransferase
MQIDVITLFPEYFAGILSTSLLGKAVERGDVRIVLHQLREFSADRHRTVDDAPYGGGQGMILKPEPLVAAIEQIAEPNGVRILLSPRGRRFTQSRAAELARASQIVLVCGRYEGIDERVSAWVDDAICIGDYVLSGGEAAAAVVIDAVVRLVPGVVGNCESIVEESFSQGLLEHAQFTRPEAFRGRSVPEVLLSGNHAEIARWRLAEARAATRALRPDLLAGRAAPDEAGHGKAREGPASPADDPPDRASDPAAGAPRGVDRADSRRGATRGSPPPTRTKSERPR